MGGGTAAVGAADGVAPGEGGRPAAGPDETGRLAPESGRTAGKVGPEENADTGSELSVGAADEPDAGSAA
jgi:hypothetical protein